MPASAAAPNRLHEPRDPFVQLSAVLTGLETEMLWGTGMAAVYEEVLREAAGAENTEAFLAQCAAIDAAHRGQPVARHKAYQSQILGDPRFGPMAQSLIQLWYLATWPGLSTDWHASYGGGPNDTSRVISVAAYPQSLVYTIAGAHPPGAKQPGFASWAFAPSSDLSATRSCHE